MKKPPHHHPLYSTWIHITHGCTKPHHKMYRYWGEKGIKVDGWPDYKNFHNWALLHGWKKGLCLTRKNSDKDFNAENCIWLPREINMALRKNTKITAIEAADIRTRVDRGEKQIDLAREYEITPLMIWLIVHGYKHKSGYNS